MKGQIYVKNKKEQIMMALIFTFAPIIFILIILIATIILGEVQ